MTDLSTRVQDASETELSRLNSSKALFAMTEGEMSEQVLLSALATRFDALATVYEEWGAEGDGELATIAAGAAETVGEHLATIREAGDLSDVSESPADDPVAQALANQSDDVARFGAIVGEALVTGKVLDQVVGFFVGNADPQTAGTFREVRDETEQRRTAGQAALSDADVDAAATAATAVVDAAYDDYVDRLEAQGVNPKPVC